MIPRDPGLHQWMRDHASARIQCPECGWDVLHTAVSAPVFFRGGWHNPGCGLIWIDNSWTYAIGLGMGRWKAGAMPLPRKG
jgi:hypothetical protein